MYNKILMYFYSGTGNTYRVAKWAEACGKEAKIETVVKPFDTCEARELENGDQTLLGILFPIHGLTAPLGIIQFAMSLPKGRGRHCFILSTRGGGFITKWDPGYQGNGNYLIAAILKMKGYVIRGIHSIDMPATWNAIMPSYRENRIHFLLERGEKRTRDFVKKIFEGRRIFKGTIFSIIGVLLAPISLLYILFGRRLLGKIFFTNHRCTGCGLCAKICPSQAIQMRGRKEKRPYWEFSCESCMRCMAYCPKKAIEASHPLLALLIFFGTLPLLNWITKTLGITLENGILRGGMGIIIWGVGSLLAAFLAHFMIHVASTNKVFNKLLCFTTLTSIYKRYHEPGTRHQDLTK